MSGGNPNPDRGFTLFVATLALVIAMGALLAVAFKMDHNGNGSTAMMSASPRLGTASDPDESSAVEDVELVLKSDEEHAKKGPEGSWHDAFLPADFSVKAGATVRVTVYNYDEGPHTFTAPGLEADAQIAAGTEAEPAVTTFVFHAPTKAGRYSWFCALPCDPWAMDNNGYMRGSVTVV